MHTKINKHPIAPNFLIHVADLALLNYKRKHAYI
jgi:hypothetical protein